MTLQNVPRWAWELLDSERVARLALLDADGRPRVLPVTFALAEGAIWSVIDDKPKRTPEPARVRWLRRRPHAALLLDVYDDDWSRLAWLQLLGEITVIEIDAAPAAAEALAARYVPYAEQPPPGPLLRLEVSRALHWRADEWPC